MVRGFINSYNPHEIMAKDPAFLFYPDHFTSGTQFFNDEQVGKYIRLLCAQHQHGHLTEKQMNHICKSYDDDVFSKFTKDDDGLYYNERLELEITRRRKYSESRSDNRSNKNQSVKGKETIKDMKNISETYEKDMVTVNVDVNNTKKGVRKKFVKPTLEEFTSYFIDNEFGADLAKRAFHHYDSADWLDSKGNAVLNWKQKCQSVWFRPENKPKMGSGEKTQAELEEIYDRFREKGATGRFNP